MNAEGESRPEAHAPAGLHLPVLRDFRANPISMSERQFLIRSKSGEEQPGVADYEDVNDNDAACRF
jgi:hypothetical protein